MTDVALEEMERNYDLLAAKLQELGEQVRRLMLAERVAEEYDRAVSDGKARGHYINSWNFDPVDDALEAWRSAR